MDCIILAVKLLVTTWARKIRVAFEFYSVEDLDLQFWLAELQLVAMPKRGIFALLEQPENLLGTLGLTLLDMSCTTSNSYGG